jgi:hypothetical protein
MILRFLTVLAIAVWFGGFTFYSTAVISTAQEVLHSHLRAGLITQQVTGWLNLISLPALAVCLANLIGQRKSKCKGWLWLLAGALGVMVLLQAALFAVHPMLDKMIVNREIADEGAFFKLHRVYLVLSTGQWLATLGYVWSSLRLWRAGDMVAT